MICTQTSTGKGRKKRQPPPFWGGGGGGLNPPNTKGKHSGNPVRPKNLGDLTQKQLEGGRNIAPPAWEKGKKTNTPIKETHEGEIRWASFGKKGKERDRKQKPDAGGRKKSEKKKKRGQCLGELIKYRLVG